MIFDFYSKAVLTVIAIALVILAARPWLEPPPAWGYSHVLLGAKQVMKDVNDIARGHCFNRKIC